uniref:Phospholipase A2 n=1 Tax=Naja naja TaxID=35670 RepID=A0A8C6V531_NAJNA
ETARTKNIKDCKDPVWNETFCYRIQNQVKNILELIVHDENHCLLDGHPFTVLFDVAKLQLGETICLTFPLDPKCPPKLIITMILYFFHHGLNARPKELDVRLDYELCPDEQVFIQKRKKIVAAALKRVLCMDNDLQDHEVPVVAIMATGGGARAFTALHGHLLGLQKLNLLDCFTYISGSSGSTWTLSNLYEEPGWSQKDLLGPIAEAQKNMSKCKLDCFTLDQLKEYRDILKQREKDGYKTCITDLWGIFIDQTLGNGVIDASDFSIMKGLILTFSLNVQSTNLVWEWMEFTPFEVGLLKYGAYIRAEDYGSKFFMGRIMKKIPESHICFLKGMWSNVFSYNLLDAWRAIGSSEDSFWYSYTHDKIKQLAANENACLSDTVLDTFPNQLMTSLEYLSLVDTAAFIDTSYASLMKPERKVDVIIHLNYSSGSQTAGIPFPKIDLSMEKNLKECYVFEDATDSEAPIVVFFPLINDTFKKYKAPGVKRGPTEMKQGEVDVTSPFSPYAIQNFQYTKENFDKLIELTSYNIQNNKNSILQALQRATEREKPQAK